MSNASGRPGVAIATVRYATSLHQRPQYYCSLLQYQVHDPEKEMALW